MAIVYATKSGNWTDTTVWNTGALPGPGDDVYSNTFTVTINTSPTVLSISNAATTGVTAGGTFVPTNGITLKCTGGGVIAGATVSISVILSSLISGQSCSVESNIYGGSGTSAVGLSNNGSGTVQIQGNIFGSTTAGATSNGVNNNSTGTISISGTVTGGSGSSSAVGASNNSSGNLMITGSVNGGSGGNSNNGVNNSGGSVVINGTITGANYPGVSNTGTGNLSVTGNVIGSNSISSAAGINNSSNGTVNITATIAGGSVAPGIINTGTLTHIGTAQASATYPAIGPGSATQVTILTGPLLCSSPNDATAGVNPCIALRWFPADTALSTFRYEMRGATASGSPSVRPVRQLFLTDAYVSGYPSTADVRKSTTYGPSSIYTGTLAVPPAASVIVGTPVDATVGTAVISNTDVEAFWAIPANTSFAAGSMGERLVKLATVSSIGDQIAAMKQATN